jgi:osmotically-inducible protein OsmY
VLAPSARRPEGLCGKGVALSAGKKGRDGRALAAFRSGLLALGLAGILAFRGLAAAQAGAPGATPTGGAPGVSGGVREEAVPATAPAPLTPPASPATTPAPLTPAASPAKAVAASAEAAPKAAPHRSHKRKKAPAKPPGWVIQSKVQLALQSDPRFKNVRATQTQPGVIVLEGQVFDDDAKSSAQQTAAGVEGVNRVINALTTNSLQWLQAQNRIGQALQRNGLKLISVKVIGKTAYLSGQVRSDLEKDKAAQIVTSTEPDITVGTNLINVVP